MVNKQINWVLVCTIENDGNMYAPHMVGYEGKPDTDTIVALIKELKNDMTFGMQDLVYGQDYQISVAPRFGELKDYFDEVGVPLEFDM